MIYAYDGSFEGFLSCVFESFKSKEMPQDIISVQEEQIPLLPSFKVKTESDKADRVVKSILKNFGYEIFFFIQNGFLSCLEHKEIILLEFFHKIYKDKRIIKDISDNTVLTLTKAVENLIGEAHLFKGFVRFSMHKDILIASIKPKNFVLHILIRYFIERLPNENFLIYDEGRKIAAVYNKAGFAEFKDEQNNQNINSGAKIGGIEDSLNGLNGRELTAKTANSKTKLKGGYIISEINLPSNVENEETLYKDLWKKFYKTIAIKERENLKLRQNLMPKRYWENLTEMEQELKKVRY
jgi:probable DNA metabolism protein